MTVNIDKAIAQYKAWVGKKTYSMGNPRFDCSLSLYLAFVEAGANTTNGEINTITMPAWLTANGFTKVFTGTPRASVSKVQKGDVPIMYIGSVAQSGGTNGHTGLIGNGGTFWNATATRFSDGALFVHGQAVQSPTWAEYVPYTRMTGVEIWRQKSGNTQNTKTPAYNLTIDGIWGKETWKGIQTMLAFIGHNLGNSGIDGIGGTITVKALQSALNAKLKLTGASKLAVDGILGVATIKALQKLFGTLQDGVISKPTSQMVYKMQAAIKSGKVWL